ncbi:type II toxin-antitoxin system VapC family toxin [Neolewinella antarctica]|uniref:Nucleic acid-binding protein n=1 Tax=Neolewinella antarctica TaxID=442734 RepID=A0ABX0XFL1_9BACT|nr:PIN domain-containing protein [Neolewinella antarctica]NJC27658.1 putative nucleic acid-binding protein [Neolewinella antarctica]
MSYVLDTNVLLYYVRDGETRNYIAKEYDPFSQEDQPVISIVTLGEIYVLAAKNGWGQTRLAKLDKLITQCQVVEINNNALVSMYIEIEHLNLNIHPSLSHGATDKQMGKNDIWIAATAAVSKLPLITSDAGFKHLDPIIINLNLYVVK